MNYELISTDLYYHLYFNDNCGNESENYKKAKQYCNYKINKVINSGVDFIWETVMTKEEKIDVMRRIKNEGYHIITVILMPASPSSLERRSNKRFCEGWYGVPKNKIEDRYLRLKENIPIIESLSDRCIKILV